ncbi:hypothetical protein FSOLCH5_007916 [Fusarium solani]
MHSLMLTALSVLGLVARVRSETQFTNPATWNAEDDDRSNYQVYEVGDRIPIRWTTDRDRISVAVWESGGSGPFLWAWVDQNLTERSTTWRVDFGNGRFDTDIGAEHARFWFALYDPEDIIDRSADGSKSLVNSASFNVTVPDYKPASVTTKTTATTEEATTSSPPTETEAESETTSISTTATSSPTESAGSDAADKEEDKEPGLSAGAAAGIGVGASVGGIAMLAGIGFFVWRHLKKRKEQQYSGSPQYCPQQYHPQTQYPPGPAQLQSPGVKAELPTHSTTTSTSQVYEAP